MIQKIESPQNVVAFKGFKKDAFHEAMNWVEGKGSKEIDNHYS